MSVLARPQRPVAETATAKPRGNILIGVDTGGQIWMNNRQIELSQVRQEIAAEDRKKMGRILMQERGLLDGDGNPSVRFESLTNCSTCHR